MYSSDEKEYNDYFQNYSSLDTEYYSHNLLTEEKKWIVRAQWIEEIVAIFKQDPKLSRWANWLDAKLESLIDLDIVVNNTKH